MNMRNARWKGAVCLIASAHPILLGMSTPLPQKLAIDSQIIGQERAKMIEVLAKIPKECRDNVIYFETSRSKVIYANRAALKNSFVISSQNSDNTYNDEAGNRIALPPPHEQSKD